MRFNLLSSHITYTANNFVESGFYCFGNYLRQFKFEDVSVTTTYTIELHKVGYGREFNYKHDVYLSDEEVKIYLEWVSKSYHTEIEILNVTETSFSVKLTIDGFKRRHLWLLNMIRMMYEYPFNLCLKEAFRIKKDYMIERRIREDSYINLIQVILSAGTLNYRNLDFYNTDQSPFRPLCVLCTNDYINSKLTEPGYVLDIYPRHMGAYNKYTHYDTYWGRLIDVRELERSGLAFDKNLFETPEGNLQIVDTVFWLSEKECDILSRNNVYIKMYNILKVE